MPALSALEAREVLRSKSYAFEGESAADRLAERRVIVTVTSRAASAPPATTTAIDTAPPPPMAGNRRDQDAAAEHAGTQHRRCCAGGGCPAHPPSTVAFAETNPRVATTTNSGSRTSRTPIAVPSAVAVPAVARTATSSSTAAALEPINPMINSLHTPASIHRAPER